jgi:hypothetical protein
VFPDKDYCVAAFNAYTYKNHDGVVQEIDSLRNLTQKEIAICKSMIENSKLAVIDTITGFTKKEQYLINRKE